MPETTFEIWLNDHTRIIVFRRTERGRYTAFAVILLHLTADKWHDVGRFDTAHGIPHRDILGQTSGLLQKVWYDDLTPRQVFHLAIQTFHENHEHIIQDWFSH